MLPSREETEALAENLGVCCEQINLALYMGLSSMNVMTAIERWFFGRRVKTYYDMVIEYLGIIIRIFPDEINNSLIKPEIRYMINHSPTFRKYERHNLLYPSNIPFKITDEKAH